jgi:hypothetical protein
MTEHAAAPEASTAGPRPEPRLIHTGTYALWRTPAGGVHVVYQRTAAADPETGEVRPVDGEDEHLPDIPPEALPLVDQFLAHGIPPGILAAAEAMAAGASPVALLRQLAARNGGGDG